METFGHQRSLKFAFTAPQTALDPQGHFLSYSLCYSFPALPGVLPVTDKLNLMLSPESLIPSLCPDPRSRCISRVSPDKPHSSFPCPSMVGFDLPWLFTSHLPLNWLHDN